MKNELVDSLEALSEEERGAMMNQVSRWSHPGRIAQRWIAGFLFLLGSIWAVLLILSLFVLVGIAFNVFFVFGWLIYGGWFYIMTGKGMSVSLRFFWIASIGIHLGYGLLFAGRAVSGVPDSNIMEWLLNSGAAWWIPLGFSIVALFCELWALQSVESPQDKTSLEGESS